MMNGIIVPSEHSKNSFLNDKEYKAKITDEPKIVSFPDNLMKLENIDELKTIRIRNSLKVLKESEFNFLAFAQTSPRKNLFNMIKSFLREFSKNENVSLTLKVHNKNLSTVDRFNTISKITSFMDQLFPNRVCKINILHGSLSDHELAYLYRAAGFTHFISTSCGEAFGLPLFNAASSGLVVIAPFWSGPRDYLKEDSVVSIPYEIKGVSPSAVWEGVINEDSKWAHIKVADCQKALSESIESYEFYKKKAKIMSRQICKKYTTQKQSFIFNQTFEEIIKKERRFANAKRRN